MRGFRTLPNDRAAAYRTLFRKYKFFFFSCAQLNERPFDIGYHIPRPADDDRISDLHAEALDFVLIVERCARNSRTADFNGLKHGNGSQYSSTADAHNNIIEFRGGLAWWKLVRDR